MNKIFVLTFAFIFLFAHDSLYGQCDNCQNNDSFIADFCYVNAAFPELCARFNAENENFLLSSKRKDKLIPETTDDSLKYYLQLVEDRKIKLSATEVLFIQEALKVWKKEKRDVGLTFTESGLGYKISTQGEGSLPEKGQKVIVHYTGILENGKKFDSSVDRGQPFVFTLGVGQVIKGWDEGISLLPIGSKALLKIPSELAYGPRGAGGVIPPDATLYFEVELIGVE